MLIEEFELTWNTVVGCVRVEDTGDGNANVGLGVVSNDGGVDNQGQKSVLVGSSVLLQQSGGVVVADGGAVGALGSNHGGGRSHDESLAEHVDGRDGELMRERR